MAERAFNETTAAKRETAQHVHQNHGESAHAPVASLFTTPAPQQPRLRHHRHPHLALGIGATTAIFSILDAVLLRPLPFPHPDRLVAIASKPEETVSIPTVQDWQTRGNSFESIAAYLGWSPTVRTSQGTQVGNVVEVSQNFFATLGTSFALGSDLPQTFLAILGTYGLLAYEVSLREKEIGIRLALGCSREAIVQLLLGQESRWVLLGAVTGLLGAILTGYALRAQFYHARAASLPVLAASLALLILPALIAIAVPARRAAHLDPADPPQRMNFAQSLVPFRAHLRVSIATLHAMGTDQKLLARLLSIASQPKDRSLALHQIADLIRADGNYRWVGLYRVDHAAGLVRNLVWSGPGAPEYPTFPITKGLTAAAIADRRVVNVGDVTSDPRYLTAFGSTRSEIIVPILDGEQSQVVGTIDIESEQPDAFNAEIQTRLEACARIITPLWEN